MGKTETEDATHDFSILSFMEVFKPAQHSSWESMNWQIKLFLHEYFTCNIKTNFRKFICAAVTKDKFSLPCPWLCKSNFCETEILFAVVVSLVFSWISWSNKPEISGATPEEEVGKRHQAERTKPFFSAGVEIIQK